MFVTEADFKSAMTLVGDAAQASSRGEFATLVLPGLQRMFGPVECSYGELTAGSWRWALIDGYPTSPGDMPTAAQAVRAHPDEHPFVAYTRHGGAGVARLSQICPPSVLRRSALYADFFRPRGMAYSDYAVLARTPDRIVGLAVGRGDRELTAGEHELYSLLRRPLGRVWLLVQAAERLRDAVTSATTFVSARGAHTAWDGLTDGERRVASLVAHGLNNAAIAEGLGVSVKAVEQHLTHVYRKIGVRSRTQLIAVAPPAYTEGVPGKISVLRAGTAQPERKQSPHGGRNLPTSSR